MTEPTCPKFELCEAPICPKDGNEQNGVWYLGECVCILTRGIPLWVKRQRKLNKLFKLTPDNTAPRLDLGYFTVASILRKNIRPEIKGDNPDKHRIVKASSVVTAPPKKRTTKVEQPSKSTKKRSKSNA